MDLTWVNLSFLYYTSKLFGLLPFAGNMKCLSLSYSTVVWSLTMFSFFQIASMLYQSSHAVSGYEVWLNPHGIKVMLIAGYIMGTAAALTIVISAQKSFSFFTLMDKFNRFDQFFLQTHWQQNGRVQIYYTVYIGFCMVYHHLSVFGTEKENIKYMFWPITSCLSMLASVQYIIFLRMLRERYEITNVLFKNCMDDTKTISKCLYPREIDRLFRELRCLTNEVKAHYSTNALVFVVETAGVLAVSVTLLSVNLIYLPARLIDFHAFLISVFRVIMFIFFVQEAHSTIKPTKQTVLIAHEALSRTSNAVISKELGTLITNCWNYPTVFDVHNLFDLDYQLIYSMFAATVTYIVVFVQIQLAVIEQETKANQTTMFN